MSSGEHPVRFGVFQVDLQAGELRKQGVRIKLREQPFQILSLLLERPGQLVSRDELQRKLWPADTFVDFDRGLNKAITYLREALGDSADNPRFIETLPKRGYRFLASVENSNPIETPAHPDTPPSQPVHLPPAALPPTTDRPSIRNRLSWAIVGVLAVVSVVTGALLWRDTRPADSRLMRFNVDLGTEAEIGITKPRPLISPDGTRIVFAVKSATSNHKLATRLLDQPIANMLAGTEGAVDPFFSPDGQWIGFFADQKIKKVPVQGGAVVTLCDTFGERGATWGEDGNIIANVDVQHLFRIPAAGGTPQIVGRPEEHGERTWRWPQVLPGGDNVLFTGAVAASGAAFDNANIEVLSLKSSQVKIVQRGGYFGRYLPSGHLVYVHQGTLYGVPFDPTHLVTRGTPTPLLEDVADAETGDGFGRFDFSRTGTVVYLSDSGAILSPAAWLGSTGKERPAVSTPAQAETPRLSPDGNRLALTAAGDIWVYDLQREAKTRLTFNAAHNRHPSWMPDGKHIIFGSGASPSGGEYSIWWIRADGVGQPEKLFGDKTPLVPVSISPDGRLLAFIRTAQSTDFEIWMIGLDLKDPEHPKPGKPEQIVQEPVSEVDPTFSPDGHWLAYSTTLIDGQKGDIIVRPFPITPSAPKWQISSVNGRFPIWSRSGHELFYLSNDNRIMVTRYTADRNSFVAEKPRQWSPVQLYRPANNALWNLDLAPDGKRFIVLAAPEDREAKATVHVTVLLNFFEELRRRVTEGNK